MEYVRERDKNMARVEDEIYIVEVLLGVGIGVIGQRSMARIGGQCIHGTRSMCSRTNKVIKQ